MTILKGFRVKDTKGIRTRKQAIYFCTQKCPNFKLGCAVDCVLRKRFKIPPHGSKYPKE